MSACQMQLLGALPILLAVAATVIPSPALGELGSTVELRYAHARQDARGSRRALLLWERHKRYEPYVLEAASRCGLPSALVRAVIRVESDYQPNAVSSAGAVGLMQIMPIHLVQGVDSGFDPGENIFVGARLLRQLIERWHGSLVLALASYNAGLGAVKRHKGVPPFAETRAYVMRVTRHYRAYRAGRILLRR